VRNNEGTFILPTGKHNSVSGKIALHNFPIYFFQTDGIQFGSKSNTKLEHKIRFQFKNKIAEFKIILLGLKKM